MIMKKVIVTCLLFVMTCFVAGCDPINRHVVLSTIFDGVPSMPPPEQICTEYAEKRVEETRQEMALEKSARDAVTKQASQHLPYLEKNCSDCHDKTKKGGLVAPRNELCFVCHTDFVKGAYVHGPVAVGDCYACHLPHNSAFPSLLKTEAGAVCATCHREKRAASSLHDKAAAKQLGCLDCHDPHFSNAPFFLR
ncbi:MAG: cytochrome family protein [Deltaproteobacteria bacterium]|nr:cytochrome family protein [Deltaproteobacteria bacterium]